MLDWLIVGGGIHGTYLSHFLIRRVGIDRERLRVLDPHEAPLALWDRFAANTGMEFLRSPGAHHLHYDPFSLRTFSLTRNGQPYASFTEPYSRPSTALFRAHSETLIHRHRLDAVRLRGRAHELRPNNGGWRVETEHGGIEARRVILAIGATEQPYWPPWAISLREAGAPVHHVFDPAFRREALPEWSQAVVIGGGITAAQTALAMIEQRAAGVTLLMRHPIRVHHFDADPCWIGDGLQAFRTERDYARRREIINRARHRGSLPHDVAHLLQAAATSGLLTRRIGEVVQAEFTSDGWIHLTLDGDHGAIAADCLILATGFDAARPGGEWLSRAVWEHNLPVADCGYPIVDPTLCWRPGLYVSGPLAELEVGPVARNIIGARLAGDRVACALR